MLWLFGNIVFQKQVSQGWRFRNNKICHSSRGKQAYLPLHTSKVSVYNSQAGQLSIRQFIVEHCGSYSPSANCFFFAIYFEVRLGAKKHQCRCHRTRGSPHPVDQSQQLLASQCRRKVDKHPVFDGLHPEPKNMLIYRISYHSNSCNCFVYQLCVLTIRVAAHTPIVSWCSN